MIFCPSAAVELMKEVVTMVGVIIVEESERG